MTAGEIPLGSDQELTGAHLPSQSLADETDSLEPGMTDPDGLKTFAAHCINKLRGMASGVSTKARKVLMTQDELLKETPRVLEQLAGQGVNTAVLEQRFLVLRQKIEAKNALKKKQTPH